MIHPSKEWHRFAYSLIGFLKGVEIIFFSELSWLQNKVIKKNYFEEISENFVENV